jgi:hypothetical protein
VKKEKKSAQELRIQREKYLNRIRLECRKSRQKKIDSGLSNISAWVPSDRKEEIKQRLRELCEEYLKKKETRS